MVALDHTALLEDKLHAVMNNPQTEHQLFRIGNAVAARHAHTAAYDALQLVVDI